MLNLEYVALNSVMGLISALIVYYLLQKKAEKTIIFYKKQLKEEAEKWLNSDNGQKAIYQIGAIIGNGAKAGFGIKSGSGKFKFENLIGEIAGRYIQDKFLPQSEGQPTFNQRKTNSLNIE